jgi:hypothetical protein
VSLQPVIGTEFTRSAEQHWVVFRRTRWARWKGICKDCWIPHCWSYVLVLYTTCLGRGRRQDWGHVLSYPILSSIWKIESEIARIAMLFKLYLSPVIKCSF